MHIIITLHTLIYSLNYLGKKIFEYQETKPSNKLIPAIFSEFQCVALFVVHTFHPTMFLHTDVYLKEIHLSQPRLISGFLKNPKGSNILFTCSTVASEGTKKKGNENEAKELIYFISKFCSFIPQLIFAFHLAIALYPTKFLPTVDHFFLFLIFL